MMKHFLTLIAVVLPMALSAAVPASVTRAVKQLNAAPAVDVTCTINGHKASASISHPCFSINLNDAKIYFDGTTQWSYSAKDREVTVINPTAEELAESNPLLILRNLSRDFKGAAVKGKPNTVRLTPLRSANDVAEVTVTFNPATGWPVSMVMITGNGRINIANMRFTTSKTKKAASAFRFRVPKGTTVTDLR